MVQLDSQGFRLLKYFIVNDSITIDELIANEHVSKRTMTKYIQELNDDLDGIAQVHRKQQRYYIRVNDYQQLAKIQTGQLKRNLDFNDANKRYAYIIDRLIRADEYITLDDLAEGLMVSRTTLNRDIKDLRNQLDEYQAEIFSMTSNGIKLKVSKEYEVPILIENFVYDYYPTQLLAKIEKRANLKLLYEELHIETQTQVQFEKKLTSLYLAIQDGYRIEHKIPFFPRLWDNGGSISRLINIFEVIVGTKLTSYECDYLLSPLTFKANRLLSRELVEKEARNNYQVFELVKKKNTFDIALDFKHIYEQIKYHLLFLINRSLFHFKVPTILPDNVVDQYPLANDLAVLTIHVLEKKLNVNIDKVEISYLAIYFEMELEENKAGTVQTLEVAIVGQIGESVIRFIQHRLEDIFEDEIAVAVFKNVEQLDKQNAHYLLIFSDKPIRYYDQATPVVRISAAFRANELRNKLQVSFIEKAISSNLCEFTYQSLHSKDGYLCATEKMIQSKIKEGSLNASFLKFWKKREQQGSNVFENGIAIPHVMDNSDNERILLNIGVFDSDTKYQDRRVRIVFLIGIPQKLNHQLNKVLTQVYDLVFAVANNRDIYNNILDYDQQGPLTQITEGI